MNTLINAYSLKVLLFTLLAVLLIGCQKKCGTPVTEKFKSVTGQQWRLIETTDPDPNFKNLSRSTTLLFEFGVDYKGKINKIDNNTLFETPVKTFVYNIDPESQIMRLKFTDVFENTSESDSIENGDKTQSTQSTVVQYSYELGRELELTNTKGQYYKFIQFQGIISPDDKCTF